MDSFWVHVGGNAGLQADALDAAWDHYGLGLMA